MRLPDSKLGAVDYTEAIAQAKQAAIDAAATDATTKANAAETNAKKYADGLATNYATADQGKKADSALQKADITEGLTNGTISVKGEDVAIHGLGSSAYQNTDAFDVKGDAAQALKDAKAYADTKLGEVDLSGIATNTDAIEALKTRVGTAEGASRELVKVLLQKPLEMLNQHFRSRLQQTRELLINLMVLCL